VKDIKLEDGERLNRSSNMPIIHLNAYGNQSFLWIGNDAPNDKMCFATLSGVSELRRLAIAILKEVGAPNETK
jgi:hypothetical protein